MQVRFVIYDKCKLKGRIRFYFKTIMWSVSFWSVPIMADLEIQHNNLFSLLDKVTFYCWYCFSKKIPLSISSICVNPEAYHDKSVSGEKLQGIWSRWEHKGKPVFSGYAAYHFWVPSIHQCFYNLTVNSTITLSLLNHLDFSKNQIICYSSWWNWNKITSPILKEVLF